jgi:hypothetical protein
MQRPDICERIEELRSRADTALNRAIERVSLTKEWVVAVANVEAAKARGDGAVINRALELLGRELGMFVERTENLNTIYGISDQPMTPEEWAKTYAGAPADKSKH